MESGPQPDDIVIFSRVLRDSTTCFVGPSLRPSVCRSVRHTLLFLGFWGLWPYCSCPNDSVASNIAPAHPHATSVAVYPALFVLFLLTHFKSNDIISSHFDYLSLARDG